MSHLKSFSIATFCVLLMPGITFAAPSFDEVGPRHNAVSMPAATAGEVTVFQPVAPDFPVDMNPETEYHCGDEADLAVAVEMAEDSECVCKCVAVTIVGKCDLNGQTGVKVQGGMGTKNYIIPCFPGSNFTEADACDDYIAEVTDPTTGPWRNWVANANSQPGVSNCILDCEFGPCASGGGDK